jgi:hypothetical protein
VGRGTDRDRDPVVQPVRREVDENDPVLLYDNQVSGNKVRLLFEQPGIEYERRKVEHFDLPTLVLDDGRALTAHT